VRWLGAVASDSFDSMAARSTTSLALELVEFAAEARDREGLLREAFAAISRHLGVDSASLVTVGERDLFTWNKPDVCKQAWHERGIHYLREGTSLLAAAARSGGVAQDLDVLSRDERGRSSFYAEYMRPLGASSAALVLIRSGSGRSHVLSFSRHGRSVFRERDLTVLRGVRSALAVVARICPQMAARPEGQKPRLTPREAEIAGYVIRGLRNAEIAALCGSSPFTVRNQLAMIFQKLEVTTRAELVARLLEERAD
jgi:DNA-binding CsgD family transcriptional regulator